MRRGQCTGMAEAARTGPDLPSLAAGETGKWGVDANPRAMGLLSSEEKGQQGLQQKDGETEAQRGTWAYWESAESGLKAGLQATRQGRGRVTFPESGIPLSPAAGGTRNSPLQKALYSKRHCTV